MTATVTPGVPVVLVKGDDEVLVGEAVIELVHTLVADGDRQLLVEELDASRYETPQGDYDIAPIVDAAQTLPFLTDRRVVVARHAAVFTTKDAVGPLVSYLADPLDSTSLVLVWERAPKPNAKLGAVPKSLVDAIAGAGGTVLDTKVGKVRDWMAEHLKEAPVRLDADARRLIGEHLGEDVSRLGAILTALEATYGHGAKLGSAEVEPYLGEQGGVAPWDLTDAIDRGDVPGALDKLHRLMSAGDRHPLQIMSTLHTHVGRMLALDAAGVANEAQAAEVLGMGRSTFPAKKALEQGRKLGRARVQEMICLLADADLDLRGAKAWPDEVVMEVLVARLAGRSRAAAGRRPGRRQAG